MIREIYNGNKKAILATYTVLIIETLVFSLFPFYLGKSIDGLLEKQYGWFTFYISVCAIGIVIGISRRMFDTRVFAGVWNRISTRTVLHLIDRKVDASKIITRADLSTRFVDFFEYNIPNLFHYSISISTAVVMLSLSVPLISRWLCLLAGLALAVSYFVSTKCKIQDIKIQESLDISNKAINEKDKDGVVDAYKVRTSCYVKTSDWHAFSWGVTDILGVLGDVLVILVLVKMDCSPGKIISTVTYTWQLFGNVNGLLYFFINMKEVEVAKEKIEEESGNEGVS